MNGAESYAWVAPVVTGVTALAAIVVAFWQFLQTRQRANVEPFLKEQMALCFRACSAVALMLSESNVEKWNAARTEFWTLYLGPLCIVEDATVEKVMVELGKRLPRPNAETPKMLPLVGEELELLSLDLASAARALILRCWNSTYLVGELVEKPAPSQLESATPDA